MSDDVTRQRFAIKWIQANGKTGFGDAFESREQCQQICDDLARETRIPGMRYEVHDLVVVATALSTS